MPCPPPGDYAFLSALERAGEAHVDIGVHVVERNALLGEFAYPAVRADEEVEVLGVEVHHHTPRAARGRECAVEVELKPFRGADICRQHSLMPAVYAGEAGGVEEAEAQLAVNGQRVFRADVERGCECFGLFASAVVVDREEFFEVVADVLELIKPRSVRAALSVRSGSTL